jgi:hypothetical protein
MISRFREQERIVEFSCNRVEDHELFTWNSERDRFPKGQRTCIATLCRRCKRIIRAEGVLSKSKFPKRRFSCTTNERWFWPKPVVETSAAFRISENPPRNERMGPR